VDGAAVYLEPPAVTSDATIVYVPFRNDVSVLDEATTELYALGPVTLTDD
jgi:hypothetical protein